MEKEYLKGRGAQFNPANPFFKNEYATEHDEGLDEPMLQQESTQFFKEYPKEIVNKVNSPDVGMGYSANPYQGCEHGCIYCYARNSHQYWGFSAGLDFERKIIVKPDAPKLLEKHLLNPKWEPHTIVLSGNTDCYQPVERKLQLTRQMLQVFLKYKHPVGIITKNALVLRDLDVLSELAKLNLVMVSLSVTSLDEKVRSVMEPRTASAAKRLEAVETLSKNGIPVNVMVAPVIPGLTDHEIPEIIKQCADRGAVSAGYTMVRLNGSISKLFTDWVRKTFPDRAEKVINQISECHAGKLNDSRWGKRMKGDGRIADHVAALFKISKKKYLPQTELQPLDTSLFQRPGQMKLF